MDYKYQRTPSDNSNFIALQISGQTDFSEGSTAGQSLDAYVSILGEEKNLNLQNIKIKEKSKLPIGENCIVCNRPKKMIEISHFCKLCGKQVCSDCSAKKINGFRSCDLCFLKKKMIGQEQRKKEYLRSKEDSIRKFKIQVQELEQQYNKSEIDYKQKEIDNGQIMETQDKEIQDTENLCRKSVDQLKTRQENNERMKKSIQVDQQILREKEKEIEQMKAKLQTTKLENTGLNQKLTNKQDEYKRLVVQKEAVLNSQSYRNMEMESQAKSQEKIQEISQGVIQNPKSSKSSSMDQREQKPQRVLTFQDDRRMNTAPASGKKASDRKLRYDANDNLDLQEPPKQNKKECSIF